MTEIRYLMDENVNPLLRRELLQREPNLVVWQVGLLGAPEYGTLDPEILIGAKKMISYWLQTTANQCPFISKTIWRKIATQPEFLL